MFDPRHMVDEEMARRAGYKILTTVETGEELEEAIHDYEEGELIVARPTSDVEADFQRIIGVLLDPPERFHNWALLVDEAATLQSAHTISADLDRIIRQHPRSALIVQTTHSLQDWHRSSRDLTNGLVAFRLKGNSLEAFLDYCDGSDEMREAIQELPRHYAIAVDMGAASDQDEFRYVEPRSWWNQNSVDNPNQEEYTEEGYGATSGAAGEGNGEAQEPVDEGRAGDGFEDSGKRVREDS